MKKKVSKLEDEMGNQQEFWHCCFSQGDQKKPKFRVISDAKFNALANSDAKHCANFNRSPQVCTAHHDEGGRPRRLCEASLATCAPGWRSPDAASTGSPNAAPSASPNAASSSRPIQPRTNGVNTLSLEPARLAPGLGSAANSRTVGKYAEALHRFLFQSLSSTCLVYHFPL